METAKKAFTLAEVLITLSVIGIVAAIVLPSITLNVQEKAWQSQKKVLHSRLAQAIGQLNRLDNYGNYSETTNGDGTTTTKDDAAMSFITEGLSKVYKIMNVCEAEHMENCGIPETYYQMNSSSAVSFPKKLSEIGANIIYNQAWYHNVDTTIKKVKNTKAAAFETPNGESIAVFYNPYCVSGAPFGATYVNVVSRMCVNFIYDLNGKNSPNTAGKDIGFITVFYNKEPNVVAPVPMSKDAGTAPSYSDDGHDASYLCKSQNESSRLPDKDELAALFLNANFAGITSGFNTGHSYWSSSIISQGGDGLAYIQDFSTSGGQGPLRIAKKRSLSYYVRCIEK